MAFRSVFVDGKISNPKTGRTAYLKLIGDGETLPYLQSVSLSMERNVNMGITISLTPPYHQALKMISRDNEWLRLGNTLGVRWGYADVEGAIS